MDYDVVIIGAGPAGLACGAITARHGLSTLILERKQRLGYKVCAGGITWNGLVSRYEDISQKKFNRQHIFTRLQKTVIKEDDPIIATVNREELGEVMAQKALDAGAEIRLGTRVSKVSSDSVDIIEKEIGYQKTVGYKKLVGADGSSSTVRKYLRLPVVNYGIGIHYHVPGDFRQMEWHLNSDLFGSGYSWIFPHDGTASVGVYGNPKEITPGQLKRNLIEWAHSQEIELSGHRVEAELINFDYKGCHFNNLYLAGDAAGLASGLTGEGIYPAIVSGEYIGNKIIDPKSTSDIYQRLLKNHNRHCRAVKIAGSNRYLATLLSEVASFCLKKKIIHFSAVEMAR